MFNTKILRFSIHIILFLLCNSTICLGQEENVPSKEYKSKASYIYHFIKYINWEAFNKKTDRFEVGILGDSPIKDVLKKISLEKGVMDKSIEIKSFKSIKDFNEKGHLSHILFISKNFKHITCEKFLQQIKHKVLIVGESQKFIQYGGFINFVVERGKLKFEMNQFKMADIGLIPSSRLLRLAILNNHGVENRFEKGIAHQKIQFLSKNNLEEL